MPSLSELPPPHNLEAEKAILGACLLNRPAIEHAIGALGDGRAFYRHAHQLIYQAIVAVHDDGLDVDLVTVTARLQAQQRLEDAGGAAYVSRLTDGVPRSASISSYVQIVLEQAEFRDAAARARAVVDAAYRGDSAAVADALARLSEPGGGRDLAAPYVLLSADDIASVPPAQAVIEGIAFAGSITVLVSESGTGKTFLLLAMAAAISDGARWHGLETALGSVLIVSYEGDQLGLRVRGLREAQGKRLDHVYFVRGSDPLSPQVTRDGERPSPGERDLIATVKLLSEKLAAAGKPPLRLIVIDTARASMSGSEDNSGDVSAYLRSLRRVQAAAPGAAVLVTHHAGWQDGEAKRQRERGSSAWRGNSDCVLYLEAGPYDLNRGEAELTLTGLKDRDGEKRAPWRFVRKRVELAETDAHGRRKSTCVIEPDIRSREDREAEKAAEIKRQQDALDGQLMRLIASRPEVAQSQDTLRAAAGVRKDAVVQSISRLLSAGLISPKARQQPYTLTEQGRTALMRSAA